MPGSQAEMLKDVSPQELAGLADKFRDPEFRRLFEQYAQELAEPQARAEQDAYLRQLESQGQTEAMFGPGVQLIQPQPGCVIKTKDASGQRRVYVNVVTCDKVREMACDVPAGGSRPQLQLTMVLHSKDAKQGAPAADGGPVLVWDLAVHPGVLKRAATQPHIKNTLCLMAIERVEEVSGMQLLREYKLPHISYKPARGSTKPGVMVLRTGEGGEVVDGYLRPLAALHAGLASTPSSSSSSSSRGGGGGRSSFFGKGRRTLVTTAHAADQDAQAAAGGAATAAAAAVGSSTTPGFRHACGAVTPAWQLVERQRADLGQAWRDTGRGLRAASSLPEALVMRVELPGVCSASAVQLDVASDALRVEVPGRYLLQLRLAHKVADEPGKSKAAFNTAKQQLTLVLPTQPPQDSSPAAWAAAPPSLLPPQQQQQQQERAGQEQQQQQEKEGQEQEHPFSPQQEQRQQQAQQHPRPAAGVGSSSKSENQQCWEELHRQLDSQLSVDSPQEPAAAAEAATPVAGPTGSSRPAQGTAPACAPPIGLLKPRLLSSRVAAADLD